MARTTEETRAIFIARLPERTRKTINADGSKDCHQCGKRLPATTNRRDINVGILWSHNGIDCQFSDEEKYGR